MWQVLVPMQSALLLIPTTALPGRQYYPSKKQSCIVERTWGVLFFQNEENNPCLVD